MDILFLHTPKFNNHYKPISDFTFVLFPPIGLLGLADYLRQNGLSSRLVHLAVERHVQGQIDVERLLGEHQPAMIGLDLHWHFQSYDVIEMARKIKKARPQLPIVLGGFTASLFAEEILADFDCVDFVIRGEAEVPLVQLIRQQAGERAFGRVPNLAFRKNGGVVLNESRFVADAKLLDTIRYTDFSLLKDHPVFVRAFSRYMQMPALSETAQNLLFRFSRAYQVYLGRGCVHACSYCGGSREAQAKISGRQCVAVRSVGAILSSIKDLQRFGFNEACLALDSFPRDREDDFYIEIFEGIRKADIGLNIEVERYFPPSRAFLESFSRLPGKGSFITISPHTPNEELRRKNDLYRYSNQELEHSLALMEELGVNNLLCFTTGLPFETMQDLRDMAAYQARLRRKFKRMRFKTCMIEIEPGSGMSLQPEKYGVQPRRVSFADYYRYHGQPGRNHWQEMGYERRGCPGQGEVARFFCTHFCERFKAGRLSPLLCNSVGQLWKLGAFRLFDRAVRLFER